MLEPSNIQGVSLKTLLSSSESKQDFPKRKKKAVLDVKNI